jgi:hypothetical protein
VSIKVAKTDTAIAGRVALWLAGLFAAISGVTTVANIFLNKPVSVPGEFVIAYLFGTLATFMAYVYGRLEETIERQTRILNLPARGVEVFHSSEKFLEKLIEITIGAESVSTLNLSPPRGQHPNLDVYFQRLHQYIRSRRTPLRSFRSIASIDSEAKSAFLLARSCELAETGRASFAVFPQSSLGPLDHPLSVHITEKDGESFIFLYPPVDLTGTMDSVLIRNEAVAKVMLDYFNVLWRRSVVLNEGKRVHLSGVEHVAAAVPSLRESHHYQKLREMAVA